MTSLQKGSVLVLMLVVAAFPVLGQLAPGVGGRGAVGQRTPVPLPEGNELNEEGLLDTEGEVWWAFAAFGQWYGWYKEHIKRSMRLDLTKSEKWTETTVA